MKIELIKDTYIVDSYEIERLPDLYGTYFE
jgi:hypothetical protein